MKIFLHQILLTVVCSDREGEDTARAAARLTVPLGYAVAARIVSPVEVCEVPAQPQTMGLSYQQWHEEYITPVTRGRGWCYGCPDAGGARRLIEQGRV